MIIFTKEQIDEAVDALPYETHKVLFSRNIKNRVQKVGLGSGLRIEQTDELNNVVNFTIMNLVSKEHLESVLQQELSISPAFAKNIITDLDREIFASLDAIQAEAQKEERGFGKTKEVTTPENLPTSETSEALAPNPAPAYASSFESAKEQPVHPFEEKMRETFTPVASETIAPKTPEKPESRIEQATPVKIETPPVRVVTPSTPPTTPRTTDPYREPVE